VRPARTRWSDRQEGGARCDRQEGDARCAPLPPARDSLCGCHAICCGHSNPSSLEDLYGPGKITFPCRSSPSSVSQPNTQEPRQQHTRGRTCFERVHHPHQPLSFSLSPSPPLPIPTSPLPLPPSHFSPQTQSRPQYAPNPLRTAETFNPRPRCGGGVDPNTSAGACQRLRAKDALDLASTPDESEQPPSFFFL
jgi:hypothetical protein